MPCFVAFLCVALLEGALATTFGYNLPSKTALDLEVSINGTAGRYAVIRWTASGHTHEGEVDDIYRESGFAEFRWDGMTSWGQWAGGKSHGPTVIEAASGQRVFCIVERGNCADEKPFEPSTKLHTKTIARAQEAARIARLYSEAALAASLRGTQVAAHTFDCNNCLPSELEEDNGEL